MHHPPGESVLTKNLVARAARTWEGHKTQAQSSLCPCGVPENLNLSSLDLEVHATQGRLWTGPLQTTWSLSSVDRDSTHAVSGANPGWPRDRELPTHASEVCLQ